MLNTKRSTSSGVTHCVLHPTFSVPTQVRGGVGGAEGIGASLSPLGEGKSSARGPKKGGSPRGDGGGKRTRSHVHLRLGCCGMTKSARCWHLFSSGRKLPRSMARQKACHPPLPELLRKNTKVPWVDALRSILQGLSTLIPLLSLQIISILTRRTSDTLQPVVHSFVPCRIKVHHQN